MSKKIFSLLLSLIMILSLCACGDKKNKETDENEEKSPKEICESAQRNLRSKINRYLNETDDEGKIIIGKDGELEVDCEELDEESFKELFDGKVPHCEESDIVIEFSGGDGYSDIVILCEEHPSGGDNAVIDNAQHQTCMANQREIMSQLTTYAMWDAASFSGTIMLERNKVNCDNAVGIDAETFESLFQEVPYCPTGKTIVINFLTSSDGTLAVETSCAKHGSPY